MMLLSKLIEELKEIMEINGDMPINGIFDGNICDQVEINVDDKYLYIELSK